MIEVFNEYNPLLYACSKNNIEIIKLLIDHAEKNIIILDLNEKNCHGEYPLFWTCIVNNIEIMELLIDYANKNNIILKINEKDTHKRSSALF